jgi:hypothetical protein
MRGHVKTQAGDKIKGQRITAQARNVNVRTMPGKRVKRRFVKLRETAYCVIEARPAEGYKIGEALKGHIITGEANKTGRVKVVDSTSVHRCQEIRLMGDAFCVIDVPMQARR